MVESDVPAAPETLTDTGVATDYDTDHTWRMAPARLLKQIEWSGIEGDINHFLGIFFHLNRKRVGGTFPSMTVTFAGTWVSGDEAFMVVGGTTIGKSVFPADTNDTIAAHFAYFISEIFSGVWASVASNVVTITSRSPVWEFTFSSSKNSASGTITESGDLTGGVEGSWDIDDAADPVLNRATRDWHDDFFGEINTRGWTAVFTHSMEFVDPPDSPPGTVWKARYLDGDAVEPLNQFSGIFSTHCIFSAAVLAYQKKLYKEMADLMSAAGLTVWLQFGEFGWWFFSNYNASTNPGGGMAYYDDDTESAAQTALGRALHSFILPTDDPTVNASADADFLADRLEAHVSAIRSHVVASHAGAKFELLWPADVNQDVSVLTGFSKVGGRLNRHVNTPSAWQQKSGSGFDRLKVEALAHGATDRDVDKAAAAIRIAFEEFSWAKADVRYLIPWFNGGTPWREEYLITRREKLPHRTFWAWDHLSLLSWPLSLPVESARAAVRGRSRVA